jgi:hypothetical protein
MHNASENPGWYETPERSGSREAVRLRAKIGGQS